jgi:phosphoglycerate dehydrogenase-like enzyme
MLGMEVIAWSPNLTKERCDEQGVRFATREEVFRESDHITIHLRLGERSRGLINAEALKMMKPTAYIVNTSRGPIIDEDALVDALTNGTIAGAAIDVFDSEPLPADHRLRSTPNVLGLPHIGYVTRQTFEVFYRDMVAHVSSFLARRG